MCNLHVLDIPSALKRECGGNKCGNGQTSAPRALGPDCEHIKHEACDTRVSYADENFHALHRAVRSSSGPRILP